MKVATVTRRVAVLLGLLHLRFVGPLGTRGHGRSRLLGPHASSDDPHGLATAANEQDAGLAHGPTPLR